MGNEKQRRGLEWEEETQNLGERAIKAYIFWYVSSTAVIKLVPLLF